MSTLNETEDWNSPVHLFNTRLMLCGLEEYIDTLEECTESEAKKSQIKSLKRLATIIDEVTAQLNQDMQRIEKSPSSVTVDEIKAELLESYREVLSRLKTVSAKLFAT